MGVCGVLCYLIPLVLSRKFLYSAFRKFCDFMDELEKIGESLEEKLSSQLFTLMKTLIDEHNPLAWIALCVADPIGKLIVAVVVYAGARIGMHLVEKMEVKPSVTIKESVVDPIKEFLSEKRVEYDDVIKCRLVAPIGDYASQKIKKYLLDVLVPFAVCAPFSLLEGIVILLVEGIVILLIMSYKFLAGAPFTLSAPIEKYVPKPSSVVACFTVIILIQKFVRMSLKPVQPRMLAVLQNMLALVAVLRVEYSIRDVKNFVHQIGQLRKMTELHWLVDFSKEKSEHNQVNQWLTSVTKFLDESSNVRDFDQAKNLYVGRPTNTDNFYHNFCPKKVVVFLRKLNQKFA